MSSISILIKTKNCHKGYFDWNNCEPTDIAFIKSHECFKNLDSIQDTFTSLYDLSIFLNKQKLYGYLNRHFLNILKIFHKYLKKEENLEYSMYFYIDKSLLLWKMVFDVFKVSLYKFIIPVNKNSIEFEEVLQECNKVINDKNTNWFDFTHDLLFYI